MNRRRSALSLLVMIVFVPVFFLIQNFTSSSETAGSPVSQASFGGFAACDVIKDAFNNKQTIAWDNIPSLWAQIADNYDAVAFNGMSDAHGEASFVWAPGFVRLSSPRLRVTLRNTHRQSANISLTWRQTSCFCIRGLHL